MTAEAAKTILIVEDEEDMAFVLKIRLEATGYEVHAETSGATALSWAVQHQPDVAILDLRLPDLDGYEVCQELRRLYARSEVRVLMFTALDEPSDELRGFTNGADAYLTKRCAPTELLQTVADLLSGRELAPAF